METSTVMSLELSKYPLGDDINKAWQMLFTQEGGLIESIPRTSKTLKQHILRAALQANLSNDCMTKQCTYRNPAEWGW